MHPSQNNQSKFTFLNLTNQYSNSINFQALQIVFKVNGQFIKSKRSWQKIRSRRVETIFIFFYRVLESSKKGWKFMNSFIYDILDFNVSEARLITNRSNNDFVFLLTCTFIFLTQICRRMNNWKISKVWKEKELITKPCNMKEIEE